MDTETNGYIGQHALKFLSQKVHLIKVLLFLYSVLTLYLTIHYLIKKYTTYNTLLNQTYVQYTT